jgi:uncharacterized membrane protein YphA (DoxX/SURF4 family)
MDIAIDNPVVWWFGFVLLVIVVGLLLSFTQRATPRNPQGNDWGVGTRFFLIALRLAIGWHILFEGLEKLSSPSWSSEAYLREASGPLAPEFRELAGDGLLARLEPVPDKGVPAALNNDWQAYFDAFQRHYQLDGEQTARAQTILEQQESKTRTWLLTSRKPVKLSSKMKPEVKVEKSIPERIQAYQALEQQAHAIEEKDLPLYGASVHAKLLEAKKEAAEIRKELKSDLDEQTAALRKSLQGILTPAQKDQVAAPEHVRWPVGEWDHLQWADALVTYGLLAVGACLLLGMLTRTACVVGALYLLMFYVAMPPLPDWPASPKLEGHYLYINKTLIEMLALLTLATTRSGRWLGLDALCPLCCPWSRREASPSLYQVGRIDERSGVVVPVVKTDPAAPARAAVTETPPSPPSKEIPHGT